MLQVAYIFTPGENNERGKKTMFLDQIEEEAKSLGIAWHFVSFEERENVNWKEFQLVTFSPICVYVPQYDEFKNFLLKLDESGVKCANSCGTILWNTDKRYLLELQERGVPIPTTVLLRARGDDDKDEKLTKSSLAKLFKTNETIVVKPTVGANASGVRLLKSTEVTDLVASSFDHLAQEFVSEIITTGESSYVFFDEVFSHAARKTNPTGDFRMQSATGGVKRPEEPCRRKVDFCRKVLSSVPGEVKGERGLLTYARVDFVERESGELLLMELELVEPQLFLTAEDVKEGSVRRYLGALLRVMLGAQNA